MFFNILIKWLHDSVYHTHCPSTDETQNINTVKHDYSEVPETKDLKHY